MSRKRTLELGRLELQLMKVIWEKGKATAREVKNALQYERDLAYTTVATMLRKLEEKGFLTHTVDERTFVYKPLIQQEEVSQNVLGDLLERFFDGSRELLVNALIQQKGISAEELERLKALIDERQRE